MTIYTARNFHRLNWKSQSELLRQEYQNTQKVVVEWLALCYVFEKSRLRYWLY
jgi:hypothetical protein